MKIYMTALMLSVAFALIASEDSTVDINGRLVPIRRINKLKKMFLVMLPLTIVLAFRWNVGVDSFYGNSYSTAYHLAAEGENFRDFEIGYFWFSSICSRMKIPFFWYLFILAIFYMSYIVYSISRVSVSPAISILVFVLIQSYFEAFSALRQAFAQAICIFGFANWMNTTQADCSKKDKRYIATLLVAASFHSIALLYLLLYFLCKVKLGKQLYIMVIIIAVVAIPVIRLVLPRIITLVIGSKYSPSGFATSYAFLSFIIVTLCLWRYDELLSMHPKGHYFVNHALFTFVLMMNSSVLVLPFRFYDALKSIYVFTIPYVIKSIRELPIRTIVSWIILLVLGVFFYNAFVDPDNIFMNYQSVFQDWKNITRLY